MSEVIKKFKEHLCSQCADDLVNNKAKEDLKNGDLAIAVMDRGWVWIGFITFLDNESIRIDCCHNIHQWGTSKGLGELALKGPLPETKLYPSAPVFGKHIFLMGVNEEVWLK